MHDATKVLLGNTETSFKVIDNHVGSIDAGKFVFLKSDDTITDNVADGAALGISCGKDLSDTNHTAIVRKGTRVPVLLADAFTPTIGAQAQAHATDGTAVASGTAVNAYYSTSTLTGIKEDGTTANVALIDFPGGL
jgi:hypothetical protein